MFRIKSFALKITALFFIAATFQSAHAIEVNMPGLNGSLTSTLTSGLSMRVAERDCLLLDGYVDTGFTTAGTVALRTSRGEDESLDTVTSGSGFGCAKLKTDSYGNTTNDVLDLGSSQTNDGNLNFDKGDFFSAAQTVFSEFSGMTDGGLGIDFSFVASIDPALDIQSPQFKEFTSGAKDAFEDDVSLLDFYISGSEDFGDNYLDFTLGRFVTSWGESTFIPVGMNGFVTNALDISKLTSPSAGIKEALMPAETISLATGLPDGSNLELYYQFKHEGLKLPASGSFFGSETFGPGARALLANGPRYGEELNPDHCPGLMTVSGASTNKDSTTYASLGFNGLGQACTLANVSSFSHNKTADTYKSFNTLNLAMKGFKAMNAQSLGAAITVSGPGHEFIDGDANSAGVIAKGSASTIATTMATIAGLDDFAFENGGTVDIQISKDGLFKKPSDSGQYGIKWSTYLDDVGTGLDLGFYYANYHSKVPYIQFSMPGAIFAGDILGAYLTAAADAQGALDAGCDATQTDPTAADFCFDSPQTFEFAGTEDVYSALINAGMSAGICEAITKGNMTSAFGGSDGSRSERAVLQSAYYTELSDGRIVYDSSQCVGWAFGRSADAFDGATSITSLPDLAGSVAGGAILEDQGAAAAVALYNSTYTTTVTALQTAMLGTGARLFAAVTPMGFMDYRAIYPEDNQIFAVSGSTNVGSTTVQAEIAFRPNFPLATGAANQINQMNDKSGANDALNMVAVAGINAANSAGLQGMQAQVCAGATGVPAESCTNTLPFYAGLGAYERSDLGNVLDANGNETSDLNSRYYSKPFIRYDVWSGTLGTTTSFNASHPVTTGLGADSSVFLSEIGFVQVQDMDNSRYGHVARNGWNEGVAAGTTKCLGAFGSSYTGLSETAAALTNIGSGVVDALFGNGGYCESNPGADDFALTYRLIGTATYNNIANSKWSFSPNFAWSHDPSGNAPSSLGGFTEGRQSLSLGGSFTSNDFRISTSYTDYLGKNESQLSGDKDYLSFNVSYAF